MAAEIKEFTPDPSRKAVLFAQPYSPSFGPVIEKLKQDPQILVGECVSALDAGSSARKAQICVVVLSIAASEDAKRHSMLQKLLGQAIRRGEVKVIVTYAKRAEQDAKWLASLLSAELVQEPAQAKSLLFKIDRLVKSLPKSGEKKASELAAQGNSKASAAQKRLRRSNTLPTEQLPILFNGPLALESDLWLNVQSGIRIQSARWVVQLKGPPPAFGDWKRYTGRDIPITSEKESKLWVWTPKKLPESFGVDSLIRENGAWVFLGSQPKLQGNTWYFVSSTPILAFCHEGKTLGAKVELSNGVLNVAGDSQGALTTHTVIEAALSSQTDAQKNSDAKIGTGKSKRESEEGESEKATFVMIDPLALESDCFLVLREKPKRISRKWVLTMMGPPPDTGKWVQVEAKADKNNHESRSDDMYWRWEPNNSENDLFIREQGSWIFRGIQPRFAGRHWIFAALRPELSFIYEGESYGTKVGTRPDGSLAIAKDSQNAMAVYPLIEAGLEKIIKSKGTAESGAEGSHQVIDGDRKKTEGKSEEAEGDGISQLPEFRRSPEDFGEGQWADVNVGSGTRKIFMFFPTEVIEGKAENIRKLPRYWIYAGPAKPDLMLGNEKEEYVFKGSEPYSVGRFVELPASVREVLSQQFASKESILDLFSGSKSKEELAFEAEEREGRTYTIAKSEFGDSSGSWEAASQGSQNRRWFVFIPSNLDTSDMESFREIDAFWTYFGKHVPRSVHEGGYDCWTFHARKPACVTAFGDLPRPIQEYFRDAFGIDLGEAERAGFLAEPGDESAREYKLDQESESRIASVAEEASESDETSIASSGLEDEKELSGRIKSRRSAEGTELSGVFARKKERQLRGEIEGDGEEGSGPEATQEGPGEGTELSGEFEAQDESKELSHRSRKEAERGAGPKIKTREELGEELEGRQEAPDSTELDASFESEKASEDSSADAEQAKKEAIERADREATEKAKKAEKRKQRAQSEAAAETAEAEEEKESQETEEGKGSESGQASDPEKAKSTEAKTQRAASVKSGAPNQPTLTPLSVAFLMSELMSRRSEDPSRGLPPKEISERYCSYVSVAVGGIRVELWAKRASEWALAGTYDEKPGILGPLVESMSPASPQGIQPFQGEKALYVPITEKPGVPSANARTIGAVVFAGPGCESLLPQWASAVGHMARGLLLSLSLEATASVPDSGSDPAQAA